MGACSFDRGCGRQQLPKNQKGSGCAPCRWPRRDLRDNAASEAVSRRPAVNCFAAAQDNCLAHSLALVRPLSHASAAFLLHNTLLLCACLLQTTRSPS